jgi:hypothetical protein
MSDRKKDVCRYYAGAFSLPDTATEEEILAAIDQLPEDGMVNPDDARETFERLLSGEMKLPQEAQAAA